LLQMFHTLGHMKNTVSRSPDETADAVRIAGEERILREADGLVFSTPAEEQQIKTLYKNQPRRFQVIPPGVDTSRFYPIPCDEARQAIGIPEKNCMLLYVGRIEPLKGIDTLIRAISLMDRRGILQECPHYLAVIGGDPEESQNELSAEMQRLQALAFELKVDDLVIFMGKRSQETLPYYYSAAQMVIVPSLYESFGMVALEAMACGTPVVASHVGGLVHLIQDGVTGFSVPDGDPALLAERISTLIANPDLRARMGEQAHTAAQDYDWHFIAEKISTYYNDLIAGN